MFHYRYIVHLPHAKLYTKLVYGIAIVIASNSIDLSYCQLACFYTKQSLFHYVAIYTKFVTLLQ